MENKDYRFDLDIISMYPACMVGIQNLMEVKYPIGINKWITDNVEMCKEVFNQGKMGIFKINYTCPKKLIIPVLPIHKENGGIEWSCNDGSGVYNSIDIQNAIEFGYTIDFVGEALYWENSNGDLF